MSKSTINNSLYDGLTPSEALRKLNRRYIRKEECKDMLDKVAEYIEELESRSIGNDTDHKIDRLTKTITSVSSQLEDIELTLENLQEAS